MRVGVIGPAGGHELADEIPDAMRCANSQIWLSKHDALFFQDSQHLVVILKMIS
jgi:hypothetical protein